MDASGGLVTADLGGESQQLSADLEAASGFSSLEKSRQILVFQTIQEAISAVPPRLEASFPRVVAAYTTLSEVVAAAASGQLSDEHFSRLEADIEAAGGVIAPGLWSQGDHSVSAFRAATFGALKRNFRPPVVDAACSALNARLQSLKLNDLGRVFQVVAAFFSPLTPTGSNTATLQAFDSLDTDRQVLVFRTIQDAILATPPRAEASFASVVAAFQSEVELLRQASEGQLADEHLAHLENSIEQAGGVLAPGIYAQGKQSVASFRAETFKALEPLLPGDVLTAAIAALNVRLRDLRPTSLTDLFKAVRSFFLPLLAQGWNSPTMQAFKALDPQRQALVFRTIQQAIAESPDLEATIFSSAVKAIGAEQAVVQSAAQGKLSLASLQHLQAAINECGGTIAPQLKSAGEGSVGEFIESCFLAPGRDLPGEVQQAAIAALNAKLRTVSIGTYADLVTTTRTFLQPLISAILHTPVIPAAPRPEPLPPAVDTVIEAVTLIPPLERELPDQVAQVVAQPAPEVVQPMVPFVPIPEVASKADPATPSSQPEPAASSTPQADAPSVQTTGSPTGPDSGAAVPDPAPQRRPEAVNLANEAKKNYQAFRF